MLIPNAILCVFFYQALALPSMEVRPRFQVPSNVIYDSSSEGRIVGGSDASEGQFPYIVSLRRYSTHFCGGTIVSNVYILSAAHCTNGLAAAIVTAVAGTLTLNSGGTSYSLDSILNHAGYNASSLENDISILRTSDIIIFDAKVSSLPIAAGDLGGGHSVVLSGWGSLSNGGVNPNVLQYLNLTTINNTLCQSMNDHYIVFDSNICTLTTVGEGACHGDSGGPLVYSNILVGLVSWGIPCAVGSPDVYTRISAFVEWVQENAT